MNYKIISVQKIIKQIVYTFFNETQVLRYRKWVVRFFSFKKDIYTTNPLIKFDLKGKDVFFGYYDISPFKYDSQELLFLAKSKTNNNTDIMIGNLENGTSKIVTSTKATNWQQGSRLRWFPQSKETIAFNDFDNNVYITRIFNIISGESKTLSWPLYDIDKQGKYGLTIDFARLGVMRPGYGYTNYKYHKPDNLSDEGIGLVNIQENTFRKIITYADILNLEICNFKDMENSYINHLSFSPNGERFLFFWITIQPNGVHKASLLVYDLQTEKINVLESKLIVSHYTWLGNNKIIATAYNDQRACNYYLYDLNGIRTIYLPKILNKDGHPTMININLLLTDTYPDTVGFQKVLLIDTKKEKVTEIVEIYSTYKHFGEMRCDLHPRIDSSKKDVCFDANVSGNRAIYVIKNVIN